MTALKYSDLKKMLICASDQVSLHKDEINRANVFPVPDSDTGSNLANTLLAIKQTALNSQDDTEMISEILNSALLAAQGNSGIVFSAFLNGMLVQLKDTKEISYTDLLLAIEKGYASALTSIQNPLAGTMIDLMKELHETFKESPTDDIKDTFAQSLDNLRETVYETENRMQILKDNHVVDAGAIGFYFIIKGFCIAIGISDFEEKAFVNERVFKRHNKDEIADHVYEVVTILHNPTMSIDQMREMLDPHGNCLDIIEIEKNIKIHIHTDTPNVITEMISLFGEIESTHVVDMRTNAHINI